MHLYTKESKTHMEALAWWRHTRPTRTREKIVVENLVGTALSVVKKKWAAMQYKTSLVELFAAGADVGDFFQQRLIVESCLSI